MTARKIHRHVDLRSGSLERIKRRMRVRHTHSVRRTLIAPRSHGG